MLEIILIAMIIISLTNAISHLWGVLFECDIVCKRIHQNKVVGWMIILIVALVMQLSLYG